MASITAHMACVALCTKPEKRARTGAYPLVLLAACSPAAHTPLALQLPSPCGPPRRGAAVSRFLTNLSENKGKLQGAASRGASDAGLQEGGVQEGGRWDVWADQEARRGRPVQP